MLEILYYLFIFPIYLLLEILFHFFNSLDFPMGFIIFLISYFIHLLSLPMYMSATRLQDEEQQLQDKMAPRVRQIKQNFKGAERYMMLSTYYRQNHYHPIMALRKSLSIAIQVPFFIAAYLFFSHLDIFQGMPLGFIKNLGAPDGILEIGNLHINILPIIMTLLNLASAQVYAQHLKTKDKIQLYIVPLLFLALLYTSPAGLVLYWTFNNLISLVRNIILRLKNKQQIFHGINGLILLITAIGVCLSRQMQWLACILTFLLLFLPAYVFFRNRKEFTQEDTREKWLFWVACLTNSLCLGLVIPSNLFISSPFSFSLGVLFFIFLQAIGFCLILPGALYLFTKNTAHRILLLYAVFFVFIATVDMIWVMNPGRVLSLFSLYTPFPTPKQIIINFAICLLIGLIVSALFARKQFKVLLQSVCVVLVASAGLGLFNFCSLVHTYLTHPTKQEKVFPKIHLSKTGKNVFVFMTDRAVGSYVPLIFAEKPELQNVYTGFTYFPNTVSFYTHTILGLPPILGGYEYTPEEMDKRPEKLVKKFNESALVLPTLFKENHFGTLMIDVDWLDFEEGYSGNLYKRNNIGWERLNSKYKDAYVTDQPAIRPLANKYRHKQKRQGFMYSLYRALPAFLEEPIYNQGDYLSSNKEKDFPMEVFESYPVLHFLPALTDFTASQDTFTFLVSLLTHTNESFLEFPSYTLTSKFVAGDTWKGNIYSHITYHVNMASLLLIGRFIQYLKDNDVYDNTRIIIVADHGPLFSQNPKKSFYFNNDILPFNPLLLVKDFNAKGPLKTDNTFMTNADVPLLSLQGLVAQPKNPFTGKLLTDQPKQNGVMLFDQNKWNPSSFPGSRVFDKDSKFLYVKDNIFNPDNYILNYPYDFKTHTVKKDEENE